MPHHRRLEEPERLWLLSNRTQHGEFLLRPDRECCRIIRGCLAREVDRKNVRLVAYAFLSNHFHLVARFPESNCSQFMRDFQGELSRRINIHRERDGTIFPRPYHGQAILDAETLVDKIGYTAHNPVRHGLVTDGGDWPGVVSAEYHRSGEPLVGQWLDYNRWHNLSRRKDPPPRSEAMVEYTVELAVPDCLPGDDPEARREGLVDQLETHRRRFCEQAGMTGRHRRNRTSTFKRVDWRTREPIEEGWCETRRACAGKNAEGIADYLERRRNIDEAYRDAAEAWKRGEDAVFPPGTYPPGRARCVECAEARAPPD